MLPQIEPGSQSLYLALIPLGAVAERAAVPHPTLRQLSRVADAWVVRVKVGRVLLALLACNRLALLLLSRSLGVRAVDLDGSRRAEHCGNNSALHCLVNAWM